MLFGVLNWYGVMLFVSSLGVLCISCMMECLFGFGGVGGVYDFGVMCGLQKSYGVLYV